MGENDTLVKELKPEGKLFPLYTTRVGKEKKKHFSHLCSFVKKKNVLALILMASRSSENQEFPLFYWYRQE